MLYRISIENFALIDNLEINFDNGLQVITGETGSGKSIILGALRLMMGERADLKSLGDISRKCVIEAEFECKSPNLIACLEENDLDVDKVCSLRRELLPNGKTRAFVNDSPVKLDVLQQISSYLIDVHSQFETTNLFQEEYQFALIDSLLENPNILIDFQSNFKCYKSIQSKLKYALKEQEEANNQKEYNNFLLNELQVLQLPTLNFVKMQEDLSSLENAEHIIEQISASIQIMQQENFGLLPATTEIIGKLSKVSDHNSNINEVKTRLIGIFEELKDINFIIEQQAEKTEVNPVLLEETQSKNNQINSLMHKHQVNTFDELLLIQTQLEKKQELNNNLEDKINEYNKELSNIEIELIKKIDNLDKQRRKAIPVFCNKIENSLKKLGLENSKISVNLLNTQEYNQFGRHQIQLLFQANKGYELKPIQTAISGGERSRVMLAIKALMAENQDLGTLVLDEIDSGVSGRIAEEMGKMMGEMSSKRQLLVITHLAQVAAKGNSNYFVKKIEIDDKTQTTIVKLSEDEKLHEIAQLLSGSKITQEAYNQAKMLISSKQ